MRAASAPALALAAFLLVAGAAAPSGAAYRLVPYTYPTIQDAEDASLPGDTIYIYPGVYREHVKVDVDNLTIQGSCGSPPTTIIDGGTGGDVLQIFSLNLRVRCVTLRHGANGLYADPGTGLDLHGVHVLNSGKRGMLIGPANGFRVDSCVVTGTTGNGILAIGPTGTVTRTTVRQVDGACFGLSDFDNGAFTYNTASDCNYEGVAIFGSRNTIQYNDVMHTGLDGLDVFGTENLLSRNTVRNVSLAGLLVSGDDNRVENSTIESAPLACISAGGDRIVFNANTISNCRQDACINILGDQAVLTNNTCHHAELGFEVEGDYSRVEGNTVHDTGLSMFHVRGDGPTLRNNNGHDAVADEAALLWCTGDCRSGEFSGNTIDGCAGDCVGVRCIVNDPAGMLITRNRVSHTGSHGFYFQGSGFTVTDNTARRCGHSDNAGFLVVAGDVDLERNLAEANDCRGFWIEGFSNRLVSNTARGNTAEGFRVGFTTYIYLEGNTATGNGAEGFDNSSNARFTDFLNNSSSGNRTDCTNDGDISTNTGNYCADGSNFAVPGEIP